MKTSTTTNLEVQIIKELAYAKYSDMLQIDTATIVAALQKHHGHKENAVETELIVEQLKLNHTHYFKVVHFAIDLIIKGSAKELQRTVLVSHLAQSMRGLEASRAFRISAIIVAILTLVTVAGEFQKMSVTGHMEWITTCKFKLTQATIVELETRIYQRPFETPQTASMKYAGHFMKETVDNAHMLPVLQKLNDVAYTLDARVWAKYGVALAAYRFEDIKTQKAMLVQGDSLIGETFYFNHRYGIDNGRIYCDGDLFTLHGGALNYAFKFADKRVLTEAGMLVLRDHVEDLSNKESLSFKEQVELYSLTLDLIDAEKGLPVGTIVHKDAKLSGLQHQSILTRDASGAHYCGLLSDMSDGYNHLKSNLSNGSSLTRQMVKDAFNPYQYGAGAVATCKPVIEAGGHLNFTEWQAAYKSAFPKAFELRSLLGVILKDRKNTDTIEFTSPSGFKCVLTALETKSTSITTVLGKLEYTRKVVDAEAMGVKAIAALSHMCDASVLHHVVLASEFDIHVIHDSFGAHPNDGAHVESSYVEALQNHLCMPILSDYVHALYGQEDRIVEYSVARLMANTLTPSMIVGGLY